MVARLSPQPRAFAALALDDLVALLEQAFAFAVFTLLFLLGVRPFFIRHRHVPCLIRAIRASVASILARPATVILERHLEKAVRCGNLDATQALRRRLARKALPMRTTTVTITLPTAAAVRDNAAENRFELALDGAMAFADYRRLPGRVVITHTETPRALRGRGIASQLVKGALDLIRADGDKVIAGCGFVADYLEQHQDYADLIG